MSMNDRPKYYLKTVGDALEILNVLSHSQRPMGIAELSKEIGAGQSKVHRILDTLKYWRCVEQDETTRKYFLGSKVLEFAMKKLESTDLIQIAAPFLNELVGLCEETVHLAVLDKGQVLYLDKKTGPQAVGIISKVGQRLPAHCTGLGKVLLAYSAEEQLSKVIKEIGLSRFTPNTITDENVLRKELGKVKELGYAEDNEEIEAGLCCIAAPVRNFKGDVVAAISISIPEFRFTNERKEYLKDKTIEYAEKISEKLGYGLSKQKQK